MLKNYLKIALRNLWKHKLFSAINVFSLASGLTVCMLAMAHIKGAFDYDTFHPNRERIYRVLTDVTTRDQGTVAYASSPLPLADALKKDYGFVQEATRLYRVYGEFSGNSKRFEVSSWAVDPAFFRVFGYKLAKGQPATQPGTVVLTRKTAEKFFGTANPLGKILQFADSGSWVVTGILDDVVNSHLKFDVLMASATFENGAHRGDFTDWKKYGYGAGYTYVLLAPQTSPAALQTALSDLASRVTKGLFSTKTGTHSAETSYTFRPQALSTISPSRKELANSTYEPTLTGLMAEMGVGLVTLLMAAFNYINLTLARSLSRAREVGIRKVSGALRWQVMGQFMAESVVLSMGSLVLSYGMLILIRPMAFVQQWLTDGVEWDAGLWSIFVLFSVVAGLLAGFVPARVLSGFQPAQVLRSHSGMKIMKGISLRKSLIVIQFCVSLVAMISLMVMIRQQRYMATTDYGFDRERVMTIPLTAENPRRLTNELAKLSNVENLTFTADLPGNYGGDGGMIYHQNRNGDSTTAAKLAVDANFIPTLGLTLLAGQNLPPSVSDSVGHQVVINEQAVIALKLGSPQAAIGQSLWLNDSTEAQIVGVIKNFHHATLTWVIQPLVLTYNPSQFRHLILKVTKGEPETAKATIAALWKRLYPYEPFAGQWYDDYLYNRHSHSDDTDFMSLLVGLAFSIAALGLLGLVTYTTQTRTKEIGIRKVMGAEIRQIIWLLSRDFVRLLLLAASIGFPLGYLAGMAFLSSFAYKVPFGFETLGLCFSVLLVLGGLTIGIQTYRAAQANPTDSLKIE